MHRTLILIAGLIVMAVLSYWCLHRHLDDIQTDILTRSNTALRTAGFGVTATVSGQDVTLAGVGDAAVARDGAGDLIAALPGVRVVDNQIEVCAPPPPPTGPYGLRAVYSGRDLVLSGTVQGDADRASLVGAARQAFRGQRVVDELTLRPSAPEGFADAVKAALGQLARLEEGALTLSDRRVAIEGVAATTVVMGAVESTLAAGLPQGYSASVRLRLPVGTAREIKACQDGFDRIMRGEVVRFATGSTRVSADSFPLLDEIAAAVKACRGVAVEVQGHTDSQGAAQSNLALSQRRAEAVVDYLQREGVPPGQLVARGYGESSPREANDTAAGRASNRRIEFRAGVSEDSEQ